MKHKNPQKQNKQKTHNKPQKVEEIYITKSEFLK